MTAPGLSHLPDFSKGEGAKHSQGQAFEPLFGQPAEQQIWVDQSNIEPPDSGDELAQLASELDQLQAVTVSDEVEDTPVVEPEQIDDRRLQELQEQHALELEQLASRHNEEVLQQLEQLQNGLVEQVTDRLELILAQSLQQLLSERLTNASIDQLVGEVLQSVKRDGIDRIKLSGPQYLVTAVSKALAGREMCHIDVEENDATDMVVHLDEQILSTRIADWTRKIEKALV